jgi:TonB family protein
MTQRCDIACTLCAAMILTFTASRSGAREGPKAEPLSPGSAVLLLEGRITGAELARWADMLADERPLWRATAARLATISKAAPLTSPLMAALEKETDPAAARDEMMALGRFAPGTADEALLSAARRFSGALDGTLARSTALRGSAALTLAPRLSGLEIDRRDWEAYFAWATGNGREALDAAVPAALLTGAPAAWAAALDLARDTKHAVDEATLARSLEDPTAGVREETYWHLVLSAHPRPAEGSALGRAFGAAPEAQGFGSSPGVLGHELLGRAFGRPASDRTALIESLPADSQTRLPRDVPILRQLRGEERAAYGRVVFGDAGAVERNVLKAGREGEREHGALRARPTIMKTAEIQPGLADDLMAASGCKVDRALWTALEVRYDADANVEALNMPPMDSLSPECQRMARVLLLTSLFPGDRPPRPKGTDLLLLPLLESFLSCSSERISSAVTPVHTDRQRIQKPRKTFTVPPVYPSKARAERRQGSVILDAVIGPTGCIRSVEVLRSVDPDLDVEALRAVTQWRYTPTLLKGVPVPVIMTVTVNFKLH